jgi:integrase
LVASAFPSGPKKVDSNELVGWLAQQNWANATLRSQVSAMRQFFTWAERRGLVKKGIWEDLPKVANRPALPKPCPTSFIREALDKCDDDIRVAILLAAEVGLRRSEIAKIHSHDLSKDLLGWSLRVHGKGSKERFLPLSDEIGELLADRLKGDRYLFPGDKDGHISPWWLGKRVSREIKADYTTHSLRHSFATRLYRTTGDLFVVQRFLGHSKPETTMGYVALADDSLREAINQILPLTYS